MNSQSFDKPKKPGLLDNIKNGSLITVIVAGTSTALTKAGLALYGFSSIGPVAGSFAAAAQAGIGSVASGSAFSIAQGLAMSGIGSIALPAIGVGALVGGCYVGYKEFKK
ncbi:unnamed protein product (macronuclear) [Paramecium tetraurelia]|uniref:Uncharacterized protein n=1 Tax=Paramecium tetraurelia TaxID=5888 RepID=A0BMM1_PARTE|nr:uncharacterized protein GSPATT00030424001 [Paramecium tetraurelia]CAK59788.1 unnamed protein product [Paramecium tetraurelia]|eukprot:XP_001427186.1 hypothetical protein (macronuclear) [Paramecium tetraurelia strain d4-2]